MAGERRSIPGSAIASDELYGRLRREWNSKDNDEIHEIALAELKKMCEYIANRKFKNVMGTSADEIVGDVLFYMFRKGVQYYIDKEGLHEATPAHRLGYMYRMLTCRMLDVVRANICRLSRMVKDQSGSKRVYVDSLDREIGDGVSIGAILPSEEKEWLQREEERIDAIACREGVHRMLTDFFLQDVKVEKQLVSACCWLLKGRPDRTDGDGDFNLRLAERLNGMELWEVFDIVRVAMRVYDIPEIVLQPIESRLMQEHGGIQEGQRILRVNSKQIAHWVNERMNSLVRWNKQWGAFWLKNTAAPMAASA